VGTGIGHEVMISYFVMNRRGTFAPSRFTDNQCKGYGHNKYAYALNMAFIGNKKSLDGNGFLLDHIDVDNMVQRMSLKGSCEEMQLRLMTKLDTLMKGKELFMAACKCTIQPVDDEGRVVGQAHMQLIQCQEGHTNALACL
jgi:hypothetical protein